MQEMIGLHMIMIMTLLLTIANWEVIVLRRSAIKTWFCWIYVQRWKAEAKLTVSVKPLLYAQCRSK